MGKNQRNKKVNKKGSLLDILWVGISLLIISMVILIGFKISNEINTQVQASDVFESKGKTAMGSINNMYPGVIDNSFLFLAISLAIGSFILAALVRIHPIFIVLFIVVLGIIVFLCGIFSNIYQKMATNPDMIIVAQQLTFTHQIMTALPFICGIFGGLLAIVMFKTWQGAGGL